MDCCTAPTYSPVEPPSKTCADFAQLERVRRASPRTAAARSVARYASHLFEDVMTDVERYWVGLVPLGMPIAPEANVFPRVEACEPGATE